MFLLKDSLKNIIRQRARYRIFVPLLLICSLLSALFLGILNPCRSYTEQTAFDIPFNLTQKMEEQNTNAASLASSASMLETGILSVSAVALLYVSSMMTGERICDIGVLYSLGLTKMQIFLSLLIEISSVCALSFAAGTICGKLISKAYLNILISSGELPGDIMSYGHGSAEILHIVYGIFILLIPIIGMTVRVIRSEAADLMRSGK